MVRQVKRDPWIVVWRGKRKCNPGLRVRLFCFPYAGGTAWLFHRWPAALFSAIEVCSIQLPGHGDRLGEPPFEELNDLVHAAADALLPYLDMPFAFFGHSMGALISFELARYLQPRDLCPVHLFVSGRRAPQVLDTDPPTYNLPEPEFLKGLGRLNGTPNEVLTNHDLICLMLPTLRADFSVCETYRYGPGCRLACPITAFGGLQDVEASDGFLEGWREQTLADCTIERFPGDHFYLHTAESVLLRAISCALEPLIRG